MQHQSGQRGAYTTLTEIGFGASSTVYRTYSSRFGQDIAVKVYRWSVEDPDRRDLFDTGYRSVYGATGHPHIMPILDGGFTTIRVVGSGEWADVGLKQAIEAGYVVGPRIVPAGHALGATGGHCDDTYLPPSMQKDEKQEGIGDSPEELKYQVRRQRKFGAEVIKVCATGGVFSRNTEPGQQQLSEAELRAIADEAHQWGLRVAAHEGHAHAGLDLVGDGHAAPRRVEPDDVAHQHVRAEVAGAPQAFAARAGQAHQRGPHRRPPGSREAVPASARFRSPCRYRRTEASDRGAIRPRLRSPSASRRTRRTA